MPVYTSEALILRTYKLQTIVRGEQNRTWFDVPADYTVKESGIRHLSPAVK